MTTAEMESGVRIGGEYDLPLWPSAAFRSAPLTVRVRVTDIRYTYGQHHAQVSPVAGSGSAWVFASRLEPVR